MNADYLAAPGTCPPFLFASNEMSYAELPYADEIVNHAHTIFGSIALVQVIQPVTRKVATAETVPGFSLPDLLTVFDSARDASRRAAGVGSEPAAVVQDYDGGKRSRPIRLEGGCRNLLQGAVGCGRWNGETVSSADTTPKESESKHQRQKPRKHNLPREGRSHLKVLAQRDTGQVY